MKKIIMSIAIALSVSNVAFAASSPRPSSVDQRVKTVTYNANDVISLKGFYGYQTTIQFAPYEKIQNISIGDSVAWQVVPNKVGNILFVKPVEERATTNMAVITDRRIYNFELTSGLAYSPRDNSITYLLKFNYPMDSVTDYSSQNGTMFSTHPGPRPFAPKSKITEMGIESVGAPKDLNFDYSYKGEKNLSPTMVFDNGEFTYFKFLDMDKLPAIFAVDNKRNESIVNYHIEGEYVVVEQLSPQFTLRNGEEEACVFNDNHKKKTPVFSLKGES